MLHNDCWADDFFWLLLTFLFVPFIALRKLSIHFQSGMQRDEFFFIHIYRWMMEATKSPKCELNKSNQIQFHYNDMLFVEKAFLISHLGVDDDEQRCLCCNVLHRRSINKIWNYNFKIATFHVKNREISHSSIPHSAVNIWYIPINLIKNPSAIR